MEIITTSAGKKRRAHNGFVYTMKKTSKSTIRWECSQRAAKSCKSAVVTDINMTTINSTTSHNHEGDQFHVEAMKLREDILSTATANRGHRHRQQRATGADNRQQTYHSSG
ncbi:hypothetical protein DPMN_099437 [Dreissena polymorpha]|uniref:FLYWCH-type domain-containing protein n=1 Tax=Dreissena polymorpha TaxID=45954 RepID=A0A9D4LGF7_DREPO|nr:hypothetical protein DPMN_099437 [Dreissena polymorpha]